MTGGTWWRRGAWMAGALALGAACQLMFGDDPGAGAAVAQGAVDWSLPDAPSADLTAFDETWSRRTPWGAASATANGEGEPEEPPLMLVGVIAGAGEHRAVFIQAGLGEVQAKAGDPLPGGGSVSEVTPFLVAWTDGDGIQHEQTLLSAAGAQLPVAEPGPSPPRSAPPGTQPASRPAAPPNAPPTRPRPTARKPSAPPPRRP